MTLRSSRAGQPRSRQKPPAVRFAAFVKRGTPDACWPWTGSSKFWADGKYWKPRDYAYFQEHGAIPGTVHVGEACIGRCCNPKHLVCFPKGDPSPKQYLAMCREANTERWHKRTAADMLWSKMDRTGACWLWQPRSLLIRFRGVQYTPRRLAYTLTYGAIPDPLKVLVNCGHINCCRPEHLYLSASRCGPNVRRLSNAEIDEVRRLYLRGKHTQTEIAIQFGIPQTRVSTLVRSTGYPSGLTDTDVRLVGPTRGPTRRSARPTASRR